MPTFLKDVLYPGTYRLQDGRKVTYSRGDVTHLNRRAKDMLADGLQIPFAWEHQDGAKPMTPAERAKQTADKARLNLGFLAESEEVPEGFLQHKLDVPNEDDAKRLPSVRFVSPEIVKDFVDGNGKLWPGLSITHLAATPRPVQHKQKPFQPVRMSCVRLSLEGYQMADDKTSKDDAPADGGLKELLACLEKINLKLGDDTTIENLVDRLKVAVETKLSAEGVDDDDDDDAPEPADGGSPIMMSLMQEVMDAKRDKLKDRIKDLFRTGRVNKPLRDKMLSELSTVKLSLGKDGKVQTTTLATRVEAYEALPSRMGLTGGDEPEGVEDPPEAKKNTRPTTQAEVDAVVDDIDVMMGRKAAK